MSGSNGESKSPRELVVGDEGSRMSSAVPVGKTKPRGSDGAKVYAEPNKLLSAGVSGPGTRIGANVGCVAGRF